MRSGFAARSGQKVRVRATLHTQVPVDKFEIVVNGKPVLTPTARAASKYRSTKRCRLRTVRGSPRAPSDRGIALVLNDIQTFAHTSPVYVNFGDERIVSGEDVAVLDRVDRQTDRAGQSAR